MEASVEPLLVELLDLLEQSKGRHVDVCVHRGDLPGKAIGAGDHLGDNGAVHGES